MHVLTMSPYQLLSLQEDPFDPGRIARLGGLHDSLQLYQLRAWPGGNARCVR